MHSPASSGPFNNMDEQTRQRFGHLMSDTINYDFEVAQSIVFCGFN
ncbi:hypothetical protein GCM10022239_26250 [Leifsonia bigeumensis]|uniref:Uncharacterized protein n=1 Tax=Leifsonella bigeumensis TaxID=433643 RepID=A0ABP7FVT0_9MICO